MPEIKTAAEALEFLATAVSRASDLEKLADLAVEVAHRFLPEPEIGEFDDDEVREEYEQRFGGQPIDDALRALRSGDANLAVIILDRAASYGGSAAAQTAWTRAGRPECGSLFP